MSRSNRPYNTIDAAAADAIRKLHKRHPKLGHAGLLEVLRQQDMHINAEELEQFMRENHIRAEKPWRPLRFLGAPRWLIGVLGMGSPTEGRNISD